MWGVPGHGTGTIGSCTSPGKLPFESAYAGGPDPPTPPPLPASHCNHPSPPFEFQSQVLLDEQLQLAAWGTDLTVAFPTPKDAATFAAGLVRVAVQPCSLADTPAAAAVVQAAAEAALCRAVAAAMAPGSCPPSPTLPEQPLAAGKRKAEAAGLQTPVVRVRRGWWAGWQPAGAPTAAALYQQCVQPAAPAPCNALRLPCTMMGLHHPTTRRCHDASALA